MTDKEIIKVKRGQKYQDNGNLYTVTVYSIKNDTMHFHIGNRVYKETVKCVFLESDAQLIDRYSLERFQEMIQDGKYELQS